MTTGARTRRVLRGLGRALLGLGALFLVLRAVVEVVTVDPQQPLSYQRDWGGPHYLGVLLVHAGPGLAVLVLAAVLLLRRRRPAGRCPGTRRSL
jgi:hypothetical protein